MRVGPSFIPLLASSTTSLTWSVRWSGKAGPRRWTAAATVSWRDA